MAPQKVDTVPLLLMASELGQKPSITLSAQPDAAPAPQPRRQAQVPLLVGVDLGGTHTRAAVVSEHAEVIARIRKVTPAADGPLAVINTIVSAIHEVLELAETGITSVRGIGISAPGPLNPRTGIVYQTPNLRGWYDVPLAAEVHQFFNVPVYLGHDATLAGYAEYRFGAGRGTNDMVYMTVSTGIGGGIIANGLIVDGVSGTAGEIGHVYIDLRPNAPLCGAGHPGCLEALASGTAIARDAAALVAAGRGQKIVAAHQERLAKMSEIAQDEERIVAARDVVAAAQQGDAEALDLIRRAGEWIGYSCVNLAHTLNPQRIVIGGGVSNAGELLFEPIRAIVQKRAFAHPAHDLEIVPAQLADDGGLIGSAIYVDYQLQHLEQQ